MNKIPQLQAKIARLEKENALLRESLREIINTAHEAINKEVNHE